MRLFIDVLLSRKRTLVAFLSMVCFSGMIGIQDLVIEPFPNINTHSITTKISCSNISPIDGERLIAKPVEKAFKGIDGVREKRSLLYQGGATIILDFHDDHNIEDSLLTVRERVQRVKAKLPNCAGEPKVRATNYGRTSALNIFLGARGDVYELFKWGRELQKNLEALPSVFEANLIDDRPEVLEILIDPQRLESHEIQISSLVNLIDRSNRLVAAGTVDSGAGRFSVKVPGLFDAHQDLLDLPIRVVGREIIQLRDISSVRYSHKDNSKITKLNGMKAVEIKVLKRYGVSTLSLQRDIEQLLTAFKKKMPVSLELVALNVQSEKILDWKNFLNQQFILLLLGVSVTILVAIDFRSAVAVPMISVIFVLSSVLIISIIGLSVNVVTLFLLAPFFFLLLDATISIVDHSVHLQKTGSVAMDAARRAVKQKTPPVLAVGLLIVLGLFPLIFWPGLIGEFAKTLLIFGLIFLATLVVAIILFFGAIFPQLPGRTNFPSLLVGSFSPKNFIPKIHSVLSDSYEHFLAVICRVPVWVFFAVVAILLWGPWMYSQHGKEIEFLPKPGSGSVTINIYSSGSLSLAEKVHMVSQIEDAIKLIPASSVITTKIGGDNFGETAQDVIGLINVELLPWTERKATDEIVKDIKLKIKKFPGVKAEVWTAPLSLMADKPIQIELLSQDVQALKQKTNLVVNYLSKMAFVNHIEHSLEVPRIHWKLDIDRNLAFKFGVDMAMIGQLLPLITQGLRVGDFRRGGTEEKIDILLRYPEQYRSLNQLLETKIKTRKGLVPINAFAKLEALPLPGSIRRVDGLRSILIKAEVEPNIQPSEVLGEINGFIKTQASGEGVTARFRGEREDEKREDEEDKQFTGEAFCIFIVIAVIILLIQLDSFFSAVIVFLSVFFSSVGIILGALVVDIPLSIIMSGLGAVTVAVVTLNHNLMLLKSFERLRLRFSGKMALVVASRSRIRPVSISLIGIAAPLSILILGESFEFIGNVAEVNSPFFVIALPFASAVVFGLIADFIFSIFVAPAVLMLKVKFDENKEVRRKWFRTAWRRLIARGAIETGITIFGIGVAWALILEMIFVRIFDIVTKQFSNPPSVWFQSLEWAAFWTFIILTVGFSYFRDGHVRVDILRERFSKKTKAFIEIIGFLIFLAPLCLLVIWFSFDYVGRSYQDEEPSAALLGSPTQFIFKAMMPLGFLLLLLAGVSITFRNLGVLMGRSRHVAPDGEGYRMITIDRGR